jgi:hypothetical protein
MPAPKLSQQYQSKPRTPREQYYEVRRTQKTEDPNRYTKHPHEYGDYLIAGNKLGGALQRDLIYWIERYTWGNPKRPEFAKLSFTLLARLCGGVERKNVALQLADIERRKLIESRDRTGCGKTTAKMYRLLPQNWKTAPAYTAPTPEQEEEAIAAIVAEDDDLREQAVSEPQEPRQTIVEARKVSRPQTISHIPSKGAEAIKLSVTYRSFCPFPMEFSCRTKANGNLEFSAAVHGDLNLGRQRPKLKSDVVENTRFSDFESAIQKLTIRTWGKEADPDLISQIFAAAGTATAQTFTDIAESKLNRPDARRRHSSGLLIHLAAEAARTQLRLNQINLAPIARYTPTPEEIAYAEREQAKMDTIYDLGLKARQEKLNRCKGCDGTGKVESGITGVHKPCGVCRGTGKKVLC